MTYEQVQGRPSRAVPCSSTAAHPEEFAMGHLRPPSSTSGWRPLRRVHGSMVKPDVDLAIPTEPGLELEGRTGWHPNRF